MAGGQAPRPLLRVVSPLRAPVRTPAAAPDAAPDAGPDERDGAAAPGATEAPADATADASADGPTDDAADAPAEAPSTATWAPSLGLLLGVAVPVVLALQPGDEPHDTVFWLQLLLTGYAGASFAWSLAHPEPALLRTMFWLFTYVSMGIAPLVQAVLGRTPIAQIGDRSDLVLAVALTLFGCVAFDVGTRLGAARAVARGRGAREVAPRPARVRPLTDTGILALTAMSLVGTALLLATVGLDTFFTSREGITAELGAAGFSEESDAGRATVRALGTVPVLVLFLLLTRQLLVQPETRRRPLVLATWGGSLLAQLVVNNPISNPRFWFLTVALSILLVVVPGRLRLFRLAMLFGLVASLVLFPLADVFRYEDGPLARYQGNSMLETIATKDYDQMTMLANTVTYAQDGPGHTAGRQVLGALLFAVPRTFWPDKPIDTGVEIGQYMNNNLVNLSEPIWAELWLDFGLVGMLAGLLVMGVAVRRADDWYAAAVRLHPRVVSAGMLLVPLLAGYSFILLRGSLLQAMGRLAVLVVCVLLLSALARRGDEPDPAPVPAGGAGSAPGPGREQVDDRAEG